VPQFNQEKDTEIYTGANPAAVMSLPPDSTSRDASYSRYT
jgi:hypothetical protein